jgi:hypothetical protein
MAAFPYQECFPDGFRRGVTAAAACETVPVKAFPTWVINGQVYEGELTFDQLEEALEGGGSAEAAGGQAAAPAAAPVTAGS